MNAISGIIASLFVAAVVCACSGTSTGTSTGSTPDSTVAKGKETAPDGTGTPSTPAPTGKSCGSADDCAYYFCKCSDGAIVNSRLCSQSTCQGAAAHCGSACTVFKHGAWTGVFGGGDSTSTPTPTPSGGKDAGDPKPPEGSCTSKDQCSPFACGCTNGSRISVSDCYNNVCQDAFSGCQSACSDSGRGDWDGT